VSALDDYITDNVTHAPRCMARRPDVCGCGAWAFQARAMQELESLRRDLASAKALLEDARRAVCCPCCTDDGESCDDCIATIERLDSALSPTPPAERTDK
jgi:hypothetical protein